MRGVFLAVAAAIVLAAGSAARADIVTVAADEWCPYNCAPGAAKPGYMIEILRLALEPAGHKVEYTVVPWSRALAEAKGGRIDAAVGATASEYPTAVFPAESLGNSVTVLAMSPERAASFRYTGPDSLQALKIGGAQNYSYDDGPIDAYLAKAVSAGRAELLSGTEIQSQNLRKLLAGRIDAVIDNENVLRLAIAEIQPKPSISIVPIGEASAVSIAFSELRPNAKALADRVDATVRELRASGKMAELLARYNLNDWAR